MENNRLPLFPCITHQGCPYKEGKTRDVDTFTEIKNDFDEIVSTYRNQLQQMADLQQEMNHSRAAIVKLGNELEGKTIKPFIKELCTLVQTFEKNAKEDTNVQMMCDQIKALFDEKMGITSFYPIHGEKYDPNESCTDNNDYSTQFIDKTLAGGFKDRENKVIARAIVKLKEAKIEEEKEVRIYDFNKFYKK